MESKPPVILASYKTHGSTVTINLLNDYHINLLKTFGFYIVHKNTCTKISYDEIKEINLFGPDQESKGGIVVVYKDEVLLHYSILHITDILIPGRDQRFFGMINNEKASLENCFINVKCKSVRHFDRKATEKHLG